MTNPIVPHVFIYIIKKTHIMSMLFFQKQRNQETEKQ